LLHRVFADYAMQQHWAVSPNHGGKIQTFWPRGKKNEMD